MWNSFANRHDLTLSQCNQFQKFYELLKEHNEIMNLTAIEDQESIIAYHFDDSLELAKFIDLSGALCLADIGTGGGFPGIPLKIAFPQLKIYLIEVIQKKVDYLRKIIKELGLDDIEVVHLDWRTFLRKTDYSIDVFCARASLHPNELVRVFKPTSAYKNARLVYWASKHWQMGSVEKKYYKKEHFYNIKDRLRKLVLFQHNLGD